MNTNILNESPKKSKKLKRAVIKEEFVVLLKNHIRALILNQLLYWTERTHDFDKFILEEKERNPDLNLELTHGWIYKSSEELSRELMVGCSSSTIRRHIEEIIKKGYVHKRNNPNYSWDRCYQYRVDIHKLQLDLLELGYTLEGYKLPFFKMKDASSTVKNASSKIENRNSKMKNRFSKMTEQYQRLHTETTPEITKKSHHESMEQHHHESMGANEQKNDDDDIFNLMKIGLDERGAISLVRKFKIPSALIKMWLTAKEGDLIPKNWGGGMIYEEIKSKLFPPLEFTFSTISEDDAWEAIEYWLLQGEAFSDADLAHEEMLKDRHLKAGSAENK